MDVDEKCSLITRNLQEVIGDGLKLRLSSKKPLSVYWGTTPTGSISVAYFFPMMKIADLLKAGCQVKILNADLHAALDSVPWDVLEKRFLYYEEAIRSLLSAIGAPLDKLVFVRGSSFQLDSQYMEDLLMLSTLTSVHDAKKSASEVVKFGDNPKLSGLLYPLMQALDEQYLGVDAQLGGLDQRKIMVYAREFLPKLGYDSRFEFLTPLIPGLVGVKMSSSVSSSKIDLLDDESSVVKKLKKADFVPSNPDNGVMGLLKYVIFVLKSDAGESFVIDRPEKFGGSLSYDDFSSLEKDVVAGKIHPLDVKNALARELNSILSPLRSNKKLVKLHKAAYE